MSRWVLFATLSWLAACSGGTEAPPRSPTQDYPDPPPRDAQGRVIGADNVDPADRLEESPRVGADGLQPAARPGDGTERAPRRPQDPCKQIGLQGPDGESRCKEDGSHQSP